MSVKVMIKRIVPDEKKQIYCHWSLNCAGWPQVNPDTYAERRWLMRMIRASMSSSVPGMILTVGGIGDWVPNEEWSIKSWKRFWKSLLSITPIFTATSTCTKSWNNRKAWNKFTDWKGKIHKRTLTASQNGLHRPFGKYQSDLPHTDNKESFEAHAAGRRMLPWGSLPLFIPKTKSIQRQIPCQHYILGFRDGQTTICEKCVTVSVKNRPKYVIGWLWALKLWMQNRLRKPNNR